MQPIHVVAMPYIPIRYKPPNEQGVSLLVHELILRAKKAYQASCRQVMWLYESNNVLVQLIKKLLIGSRKRSIRIESIEKSHKTQ